MNINPILDKKVKDMITDGIDYKIIAKVCRVGIASVYRTARELGFRKKISKVNLIGSYALKNGIKKASERYGIRYEQANSYLWKYKKKLINKGLIKYEQC